MIETQGHPCWRLVDPDGKDYDEGEGTPHHDSEQKALTHLRQVHDYMSPPAALAARQWDNPCVVIACNGCEAGPDDDVWGEIHFPDMATARSMASFYDFTLDGENAWCDVDRPSTDGDDDDPGPSCWVSDTCVPAGFEWGCEQCPARPPVGGFEATHGQAWAAAELHERQAHSNVAATR